MSEYQPMWSEIVPGLYVSGMYEWPRDFSGLLICVLENKPVEEPDNATWIPILKVGRAELSQLDAVAEVIESQLASRVVVVHCGAGIERSPLAVVWFLYKKRGMTLDEAYTLVRSKRPIVQDRQNWLPASVNHGYPDPK